MNKEHHYHIMSRQLGFARWRSPGVVGMTLIAVIVASLAAWLVWDELLERYQMKRASLFVLETNEILIRVDERFRGYRQVLRGARGLFDATSPVSRADWEAYVTWLKLDDSYPGILALGFAEIVASEDYDRHLAMMHSEGFRAYRVWPPGVRERQTPVVMIEPFDWRNARAFGFDAYSEPVGREAMDRAVDTDESALSGKLSLAQDSGQTRHAGIHLYLPVFRRDVPLSTPEERRAGVRGWVFSSFRVGDLMGGVLEHYTNELRVRIYDQVEGPEALLFDGHPEADPEVVPEFVELRRIALDGREWLFRIESLPGFAGGFDARQVELIAILFVGVLFVIVTWSFSMTRERARALARATESLRRSEARYSTLVNHAHEGIAATDEALVVTFVNPRLAEMLGYEREALIGRDLLDFAADGSGAGRAEMLKRLRRGQGARYEVEMRREAGDTCSVLVSDAPIKDEGGNLRGAILMVADITARKEAEKRIRHLATHDPLTGVPNRAMFTDLLSQALIQARRYRHRAALLFIDLDRFKQVNDEYGHLVGDRLLLEAVARMKASIRTSDTLGRQGGDEFVVLLPEIDSGDDAEVVAEKIRSALELPFILDGLELSISSSIGIALFPEHARDEEGLMRCADHAMYSAKTEGRNRTRYYAD